MEKKIHVLLSAYNGEAYIREQVDSILGQSYKNIEVYVRDDGSKDATVEILKEYEKQGQIHLEAGSNIGYIESFQWLIAHGGDADYYAFSDQDDVWLPDKLQMAVEKLADMDESEPVLYFSNYDYYDGELNFMAHHSSRVPYISFANSLVDCVSLGFNSVFNRKARDMVAQDMPTKSTGHDWWMYMVCAGMGRVVYDPRVTVKYRRHSRNVSDAGDSFWSFQLWRFRRFVVNHYFRHIREQIREYGGFYQSRLSVEDQKLLKLFTRTGFHPLTALRKVFYPHRFRQSWTDELFLRIVFLLGQL